jgi:hypothetical protein
MPDPTGIRAAKIGVARLGITAARQHLRAAAKDADEAHASELHRRIMAALAAVDDAIEEADK